MKNIKINKINSDQIIKNREIYSLFDHISSKEFEFKVRVLKCDFYMDTENYYPITKDHYYTFPEWFDWKFSSSKFYTKEFENNFFKNLNFKEISNAYIIGSSPGNNYYRNINTFLYRLLFIKEKKINIAIHRNTSNSLRDFIKYILNLKQIKLNKFVYLEDGFYLFKNCKMPSFLNFESLIKCYQFVFPANNKNDEKIYISRRNANWRVILNESDYIDHLEKEGFQIIDFETLPVKDQIKKIQSTKKIISAHGSGLTNLIFGNNNIQVIEVCPKNIDKKLLHIYLKYKKISDYKKNNHYFFGADLVQNDLTQYLKTRIHGEKLSIGKNNIRKNPYFNNFIVQEREFKKLITNFNSR